MGILAGPVEDFFIFGRAFFSVLSLFLSFSFSLIIVK